MTNAAALTLRRGPHRFRRPDPQGSGESRAAPPIAAAVPRRPAEAVRAEAAAAEAVAGAHAGRLPAPGRGAEELTALRLSLRRLQLLDELRWRRFSLARGGYSARAAKRLALLDEEIARREAEYVAAMRRNGAAPETGP